MKSVLRFMSLLAVSFIMLTPHVFAIDKVYLKDGRVLEGTISREGDGFLYVKTLIGDIESETFVLSDDVLKIDRDSKPQPAIAAGVASATEASKDSDPITAAQTDDPKAAAKPSTGARRVAILNFGAPSSWQGKIGSTVGSQILAKAWKDAIPLLEKDKVDLVVVRINSGGGALSEMLQFLEVFEKHYKSKFETVGWVESAISAAAMSPWTLSDFYFMPNGNLGACTGWSGALVAMKGVGLEEVLALMEQASLAGNRNPLIMRAMQIQQPLSATIDPSTGLVTFFNDATTGEHVVNPVGQILTFTAQDALKFGFSKGTAATPEELMKVMGIREYEWAGQAATKLIDDSMRDADKTEKRFVEVYQKYALAVQLAQGQQERDRRAMQVGIARRHLNDLKQLLKANPNFSYQVGLGPPERAFEWIREQEELLDSLL